MTMSSKYWTEVAPSAHPHEREALAFLRERLPDHEPYRAWSNFEFIAQDRSINEVDLLLLTPKGLFLVEIKSRPGIVEGDAGTWSWHHEGRVFTDDNPLLLANRKAKKLKSLLSRPKAMVKVKVPFVEAHVFLSHEKQDCRVASYLREQVHVRDREAGGEQAKRPGVVAALTSWTADNPPRQRLDRPMAKAISRAMAEAGIRPSQRIHKVSDYQLDELLFDGPTYQDWSAHHVSLERDVCRVRIYSIEEGASAEARATIRAAAQREYEILKEIQHPGILRARHYTDSDRGPALFFEHRPSSQRLDHYLAERLTRLPVAERLDLLRQVAEAIHYAHEKKLVHRALSPQSILVLDPEAKSPQLQILNWQTGRRTAEGSRSSAFGVSGTSNVGALVEDASTVYMAPEARFDRISTGELQDVFSLGALAYHLFSGLPPASSSAELQERLRSGDGLQISAVQDGVCESLRLLIQLSTFPAVSGRLDSVAELLKLLEEVEEELTAPDPDQEIVLEPAAAKKGDTLEHGFVVHRRLGKGSSAVALLVEPAGTEEREPLQVLKIALEPSCNEVLQEEAEVLKSLSRHQFIVQLQDVLQFGDRIGLLMDRAGEQTLRERLRQEGRLQPELLERFGEDLLQAVDWLEQEGVSHRDIKPENLGVAQMGKDKKLHLVLFDFSLSRTPDENIHAGTVPYLDPFLSLRRPVRWDTHAERFAAAVTLYEMATGQLPQWGDEQSAPAVLDVEATLDAEAFDASLRDRMTAFFEKALRRNYRERFDNAQEMLTAWRGVFSAAEPVAAATTEATQRENGALPLDQATLETPLILLGLSTRALNALERVGATTVEGFLRSSLFKLLHMRGVGSKTRKEIAHWSKELSALFPKVEREASPETPSTGDAAAESLPAESLPIDTLAQLLLPARIAKGQEKSHQALRHFLRLEEEADSESITWPNQSDAARAADLTRARVGQVLAKARARWLKNPGLNSLREELVAMLDAQGGVMTATELMEAALTQRGSSQSEPLRSRQAAAVIRAAIECERDRANPRWIVRRPHHGGLILVARDEIQADGTVTIDGQALADYAERLGKAADQLSTEDPLAAPERALAALYRIKAPATGLPPPPHARLRQLAAAASNQAALSSRLELYPKGMPAARALRLSLGALAGARDLTPDQVRKRVASRYPKAERLPGRPELDTLLEEAGSVLRWSPQEGTAGNYTAPLREFTTVQSGTSFAEATLARRQLEPHFEELPADKAEIQQFQQRLQHSHDQSHFLALVVTPRRADAAQRALTGTFALEALDLDELLIRHMKAFAQEKKIDWRVVLRADALAPGERDSQDWRNLLTVVRNALRGVQEEIAAAADHVLLTHPGLLARYDQLAFLGQLHEQTGRPGGPPGLWVLVTTDAQQQKPTVDGKPVPVFTSAQWARIPDTWLASALASLPGEKAAS